MRKRVKYLVFFVALISASIGFAQRTPDSLKKALSLTKSDTEKVNILGKIANYYKYHGDFNAGLPFAYSALKVAAATGQPGRIAYAEYNLAILFLNINVLDSAMKYGKLAEAYYLTNGSGKMLIKVYTEMAAIYSAERQYDRSMDYYAKLLSLATQLKDTTGIHSAYQLMGQEYDKNGIYKLAIENYSKALSFSLNNKLYNYLLDDYLTIGNLYGRQGLYANALEEYFTALKANEEHNRSDYAGAVIFVNIANIYSAEKDTSKAMEYYNNALKIFKKTNEQRKAAILLANVGNLYLEAGNYKKAEDCQREAVEILKKVDDKNALAQCYYNYGGLYTKTKQYPKALDYYSQALQIQQIFGDSESQANTLSGLSSLYFKMGNYKKSEEAGIACFEIAKNAGMVNVVNEVSKTLSDLYEKTNEPDKALFYYKQYITAKDSMDNKAASEKIIRTELNYEYDQKQQAEKLQDEKREELNAEKASHERVIRNVYLGGLLIVVVLTILLLRNFLRVRNANKIITEQKAEVEQQKGLVEQKNRDITDSINYAKRIQQAMLPTVEQWDHFFKESFIYYKPKDIVSGDFYWCMGVGKDVVVAVADCTGHGVPGAFMSMLGISSLNKIVGEHEVKQPDRILNMLRDEIIKSLNPEGKKEEVKDGMDMTLCYISFANKTLEYSAANNPLWVIRKEDGGHRVIELDADKMPVGKYMEDGKQFVSNKIDIKKGDRIYMFTDGYTDQFGGEKGKKFKYKHLMESILSWQNKNMNEQRMLLERTMDEWKGNLEQVDDIMVAGIEIV